MQINNDSLMNVAKDINIPEEFLNDVFKDLSFVNDEIIKLSLLLADSNEANNAFSKLNDLLCKDDPKGYKIFYCYLLAISESKKEYEKLGIDESIFFNTMKAFSRFLNESKEMYHEYRFDRSWWTYRQTSLRLFGFGEFEFEIVIEQPNLISVHIPTGSSLDVKELFKEKKQFEKLMKKMYPNLLIEGYVMSSWLLSPQIKEILPKESKIYQFAKQFDIVNTYQENDILRWVYHIPNEDVDYSSLEEKTMIQRFIKIKLLNKEPILGGVGYLKER